MTAGSVHGLDLLHRVRHALAARPIPVPRDRCHLPAMGASHDFGRAAERLAARWLERRGWTVIERNWRVGHREIDLVARRAGVVAFIEVKARTSRVCGHPLDAITRAKRRDLELAARAWLARHAAREPGPRTEYRFDAIWVLGDPKGSFEIEHLECAWRL